MLETVKILTIRNRYGVADSNLANLRVRSTKTNRADNGGGGGRPKNVKGTFHIFPPKEKKVKLMVTITRSNTICQGHQNHRQRRKRTPIVISAYLSGFISEYPPYYGNPTIN